VGVSRKNPYVAGGHGPDPYMVCKHCDRGHGKFSRCVTVRNTMTGACVETVNNIIYANSAHC
jgi:hypothetical protein